LIGALDEEVGSLDAAGPVVGEAAGGAEGELIGLDPFGGFDVGGAGVGGGFQISGGLGAGC
jgi:hypothetical protein